MPAYQASWKERPKTNIIELRLGARSSKATFNRTEKSFVVLRLPQIRRASMLLANLIQFNGKKWSWLTWSCRPTSKTQDNSSINLHRRRSCKITSRRQSLCRLLLQERRLGRIMRGRLRAWSGSDPCKNQASWKDKNQALSLSFRISWSVVSKRLALSNPRARFWLRNRPRTTGRC